MASIPLSPASVLSTSSKGTDFILREETRRNVSNHLHHPTWASGVTLGPGYDFKERQPREIIRDLEAIGVPAKAAQIAATGHGKYGRDADDFCKMNRMLITLTDSQERRLLQRILPSYEHIVKSNLKAHITQYMFDALVSLTFDPGTSIRQITRDIDSGKIADAEKNWLLRTSSDPKSRAGLSERRRKEVNLLKNGIYG